MKSGYIALSIVFLALIATTMIIQSYKATT